MSEQFLEGGCHCGQSRFRISGMPKSAAICHCISCRRTVGAESVGWVVVKAEDFNQMGDSSKTYASSAGISRTFCGNCGTSLTYQGKPETIDVILAVLDNPESILPVREIWLDHRISWNEQSRTLPGYSQWSSSSE